MKPFWSMKLEKSKLKDGNYREKIKDLDTDLMNWRISYEQLRLILKSDYDI